MVVCLHALKRDLLNIWERGMDKNVFLPLPHELHKCTYIPNEN